jgi:cytochrome c556
MATHRGFDSLAIAISSGATGDSIAARLGRITTSCVACHAQYRLVGRNPT